MRAGLLHRRSALSLMVSHRTTMLARLPGAGGERTGPPPGALVATKCWGQAQMGGGWPSQGSAGAPGPDGPSDGAGSERVGRRLCSHVLPASTTRVGARAPPRGRSGALSWLPVPGLWSASVTKVHLAFALG